MPPFSVSLALPPTKVSLPSPPFRVEATLEALIVSLPPPPVAVSITVSKAMPILFTLPPAEEKVPGVRSMVAFWLKPETSRALLVPWLQSVTMALGLLPVPKS